MSRNVSCCSWVLLWATTVLATLGVAQDSTGPNEGRTLRVLTYNVRYASDQPPNRWVDRRPVAQAMLRQLDVDVMGLQEAVYRQVKDFAVDLPNHDWIGMGRDGGSRGEFLPVFYRRSRLEPLEFDHYWLSDTPETVASASWGNTCRRMVTWVHFRDRKSDREFYFVNTHLDHESQASRDQSALLIAQRSNEFASELPVLLVGDFNSEDTTSSVYQTLVQAGFSDSWPSARQRGPEINTYHAYKPTVEGDRRIDWILTRGKISTLSTKVVDFQIKGQYPSDHFPVIATVRFGE